MSHSPMDLDSSLDDLIKKRKQSKPSNANTKKQQQQSHKTKQQQHTRPAIQINKAKVNKHIPQRTGINARLSTNASTSKATSTPSGPLFTAKNSINKQPQNKRTDPSKIIITKAIPTTTPKTHSLQHRLGGNHNKQPPQHDSQQVKSVLLSGRLNTQNTQPTSMLIQRQTPAPAIEEERKVPFSIRGRSNAGNARPLTIKGESGPTTVLVTGLDPMANSEDVKVSFEGFGNILHCEVLRDRGGRSFGEAEVEFSRKSAALDCIAQLDNQLVDGKFLRIILREPKQKQQFSAVHQIRSIIQPSYSVSGKMYSDQMTPRYDINRQ